MFFIQFLTVLAEKTPVDTFANVAKINQLVLPAMQQSIKQAFMATKFDGSSLKTPVGDAQASDITCTSFEYIPGSTFGIQDDTLTAKLLFNMDLSTTVSGSIKKRGWMDTIENGVQTGKQYGQQVVQTGQNGQEITIQLKNVGLTGALKFTINPTTGGLVPNFITMADEITTLTILPQALDTLATPFEPQLKAMIERQIKQEFMSKAPKIIEENLLGSAKLFKFTFTQDPEVTDRGFHLVGYMDSEPAAAQPAAQSAPAPQPAV